MEKTLKFNSQVATSCVQSERLLALGLKKETADIEICCLDGEIRFLENENYQDTSITIPAWSLHRLLAMLTTKRKVMLIRFEADLYDVLIDKIEHEIKEGYFNKEYLV